MLGEPLLLLVGVEGGICPNVYLGTYRDIEHSGDIEYVLINKLRS